MRGESVQVRKALDYASGSADRAGDAIDMSGFEWCLFVTHVHTVAAGATTSVKVSQATTSGGSYADLEGTGISIADDDDGQVFAILIVKPREQFLKINMDKDASNNVAESAVAILGCGRTDQALKNITDELTVEVHVSPAEGTA